MTLKAEQMAWDRGKPRLPGRSFRATKLKDIASRNNPPAAIPMGSKTKSNPFSTVTASDEEKTPNMTYTCAFAENRERRQEVRGVLDKESQWQHVIVSCRHRPRER
eukprot:2083894-Rhodomonas_salina.2